MIAADYSADNRYGIRADAYDAFRPSYPNDVLACLRTKTGLPESAIAVELGSGTGIFTRQLLESGWTVFAVEPNHEMRAISFQKLGHHKRFNLVCGRAEASTLDSQSCDLVVAAQSFHWFDMRHTLREILRIVRPQGYVAIVWSDMLRTVDYFHSKLHEIVTQCPDYGRFALESMDDFGERARLLLAHYSLVADQSFDFEQQLNREMLYGRMASSSYWPESDSTDSIAQLKKLNKLFDQCETNGQIRLRYQTRLILVKLVTTSLSSVYPVGRTKGISLF